MNDPKFEKVKFHPAVGNRYDINPWLGIKLLVLGESQYCTPEENNSELTQKVVRRYLDFQSEEAEHERWMNTYTKFANVMLSAAEAAEEEKTSITDFWNSVIFFNCVQQPTERPRIAPTPEAFAEGEQALLEVLAVYEPDLVIVWGRRLWDNLEAGEMDEISDLGITGERLYNYEIGDKIIPACRIYHPSSSKFNLSSSQELLRKAVEIARSH